ncbi:hypothetical protein [Terasakiella sp.]|uniref:hypothetical protein n=1 Tax=Terasakiella sp. TaxID=2034861 RepID=UPI003AA87839
MLSDTLIEAEREIYRYQKDMPECYSRLKSEIDEIRIKMSIIAIELDSALTDLSGNPIYDDLLNGDISTHNRFMDGEEMVDIYDLHTVKQWQKTYIERLKAEAESRNK